MGLKVNLRNNLGLLRSSYIRLRKDNSNVTRATSYVLLGPLLGVLGHLCINLELLIKSIEQIMTFLTRLISQCHSILIIIVDQVVDQVADIKNGDPITFLV